MYISVTATSGSLFVGVSFLRYVAPNDHGRLRDFITGPSFDGEDKISSRVGDVAGRTLGLF